MRLTKDSLMRLYRLVGQPCCCCWCSTPLALYISQLVGRPTDRERKLGVSVSLSPRRGGIPVAVVALTRDGQTRSTRWADVSITWRANGKRGRDGKPFWDLVGGEERLVLEMRCSVVIMDSWRRGFYSRQARPGQWGRPRVAKAEGRGRLMRTNIDGTRWSGWTPSHQRRHRRRLQGRI